MQNYVEQTMSPGEHIVYETRLHWLRFWNPIRWAAFGGTMFLLGGAIMRSDAEALIRIFGFMIFACSLLIFPCFVISFVTALIDYLCTRFTVTTKRLVITYGLFRVGAVELQIKKIEGVQVYQGFIDQIVNSGTVIVTGTGGGAQWFPAIAKPIELRQRIGHILTTVTV